MQDHHVILYDGVCGLCNRLLRSVIRNDRGLHFRFAPLQGAFATQVLSRYSRDPRDLDTVYVIRGHATPSESLVSRSEAVLFVLSKLGGAWRLLGAALRWLPTSWLDYGYGWVARHRYRVFGRYETCPVPKPSDRARFIEAGLGDEGNLEGPASP